MSEPTTNARGGVTRETAPMTRDEMASWYEATRERAYAMASDEPEGPGYSFVLGIPTESWWSVYLTQEQQETLLDSEWKNDAFVYLENATNDNGLEEALDAWAAHAGDAGWLSDACERAVCSDGAVTYGTEFEPEDFEPGGTFAPEEPDAADGAGDVGSVRDQLEGLTEDHGDDRGDVPGPTER